MLTGSCFDHHLAQHEKHKQLAKDLGRRQQLLEKKARGVAAPGVLLAGRVVAPC